MRVSRYTLPAYRPVSHRPATPSLAPFPAFLPVHLASQPESGEPASALSISAATFAWSVRASAGSLVLSVRRTSRFPIRACRPLGTALRNQ